MLFSVFQLDLTCHINRLPHVAVSLIIFPFLRRLVLYCDPYSPDAGAFCSFSRNLAPRRNSICFGIDRVQLFPNACVLESLSSVFSPSFQVFSIYLGTALYRLGGVCILCISTYFINFALFFIAKRAFDSRHVKRSRKKQK